MALPPAVPTFTLSVGREATWFDGADCSIELTILPVFTTGAKAATWVATGDKFWAFPKTYTSTTGILTIPGLIYTDQAGFDVVNGGGQVQYQISGKITGPSGETISIAQANYIFSAAGGTTQDWDLTVPTTSPGGALALVPFPVLTLVKADGTKLRGEVAVADLGISGGGGAPLDSPSFTGTPAAPTAAADTSTTQLATTGFVVGQAASAAPLMDGTAAIGTSKRYARADHVHASDTSRAPAASPTFTGTPAAPTAAVDTSTTQLATTAYVVGQAAAATPLMDGTAAVGTSTRFARGDHRHDSDTSRAVLSAALVNVKNTGNPLADAIMDGSPHALSTRFGSLGAAQAVFPAATALTEQIDRHAIQLALNAGSIFIPPGKAVLDTAILIPAGGNRRIKGAARFSSCLSMVAGTQTGAITCADMTVVNSNVEISDLELDGTGATSPTSPNNWVVNGLDVAGMQDSLFQRLSVHDWPGIGIQTVGISSTYVYNTVWRDIIVANNMNWGFKASFRNRRMVISGLHAIGNGQRIDNPPAGGWTVDAGDQQINLTGGVLLDCSEMTVEGIRAHDNGNPAGTLNASSWGGVGIAIRNVYAMVLDKLVATGNGSHGIFVLGLVDSLMQNAAAWNNGRKAIGTTAAARIPVSDVVFHKSDAMTYGKTKRTKVVGLSAGLNTAAQGGGWDGGEVWGLWVDDTLTDLDIDSPKLTAGSSGIARLPVTTGADKISIGRRAPLSIGQVPSGSWTGPRLAAAGTAVLVQNEARAYAWDVVDGILVSQLGIGVTVLQASAVVRLGIFKDDGTGQSPDTTAAGLIADCGTVSAAAVADIATTALATPVLLANQRVWLVARQEGAGGTAAVRIGTPLNGVAQATLVTATESGAIKVTNWTNAYAAGFANGAVGAGGTITVVAAGVKIMARAA